MNRTELGKQIERSLKKSLKTREARALDRIIKNQTVIFDFPLFESGWHLETVRSESLRDLAKKLSK